MNKNLSTRLMSPMGFVGQLRDAKRKRFLPSMTMIAFVGEGMLALGLLLPETGRKPKGDIDPE